MAINSEQANVSRGFRPELSRDLGKLRETVWNEVRSRGPVETCAAPILTSTKLIGQVKRLMNKKKAGNLVVDAEHRHHAHL